MNRYTYVIVINVVLEIFFIIYMEHMAHHKDRYSLSRRYRVNRYIARKINRTGRITVEVKGLENLPEESGYLLVSNHQGKADACAIIEAHESPLGVVIDHRTAKKILVSQFVDIMDGIRLNQSDIRQSRNAIRQMARQVEDGQTMLIFPEGGYTDNHNRVGEFKPGAFKGASYARCVIVPVVLVDTWRPFEQKGLHPVSCTVRYLQPIPYEEYRGMKTAELSEMVRDRIIEALEQETGEPADFLVDKAAG